MIPAGAAQGQFQELLAQFVFRALDSVPAEPVFEALGGDDHQVHATQTGQGDDEFPPHPGGLGPRDGGRDHRVHGAPEPRRDQGGGQPAQGIRTEPASAQPQAERMISRDSCDAEVMWSRRSRNRSGAASNSPWRCFFPDTGGFPVDCWSAVAQFYVQGSGAVPPLPGPAPAGSRRGSWGRPSPGSGIAGIRGASPRQVDLGTGLLPRGRLGLVMSVA